MPCRRYRFLFHSSNRVGTSAGKYFAPHVRAYIRHSSASTNTGAVVPTQRQPPPTDDFAAIRHNHQEGDVVLPDFGIRSTTTRPYPSSDSAYAVVTGYEQVADARLAQGHTVVWIHDTTLRTEPLAFSERNQVIPQAGL